MNPQNSENLLPVNGTATYPMNRLDMTSEVTVPQESQVENSANAVNTADAALIAAQNMPSNAASDDTLVTGDDGVASASTAGEMHPINEVQNYAQHHHYESMASDLSSASASTTDDRSSPYLPYRRREDIVEDRSALDEESYDSASRRRSMSPDTGYRIPPAPPSTPASQTNCLGLSLSFDLLPDGFGGPPTLPCATPLLSPMFTAGGHMVNADRLTQVGPLTPALETPAAAAATPLPPRTGDATPKPAAPLPLPEDFSKWSVGDRYQLVRILGRGSYGEVAQAIDVRKTQAMNGEVAYVAIKRIQSPFEQQLDAVRLYREIHILRRMKEGGEGTVNAASPPRIKRHHDCIIQLLDVVQPAALNNFHELYLVFEYVDTDLYKLIMSPQYLTTEHIQLFLYQMLVAANYLHSFNVIHRDLKPANILLNEDCSLKICDFGLARIVGSDTITSSQSNERNSVEPPKMKKARTSRSFPMVPKLNLTRQLTKHVVTRWYRAPELILIQPYTSAVDIWSLGCIFAELLSMQEGNVPGYQDRKPLFPGGTCYPLSGDGDNIKADERLDQLSVIFSVIGTPSAEDIAASGKASEYINALPKMKAKPLESLFPDADPAAIDLLKKMLQFNPMRRVTAGEALEHEFFRGVRKKELERIADSPLEGPDFLESDTIDLKMLKQRTYEEVLWYRDHGDTKETSS